MAVQQVPPHSFSGAVSIAGQPAPEGTLVRAWNLDGQVGQAMVDSGGNYQLDVNGVLSDVGAPISFSVGESLADGSTPWQSGASDIVDLAPSGCGQFLPGHRGTRTVTAALAASCPWTGGKYARFYSFALSAQSQVVIAMNDTTFDDYLYLYSGVTGAGGEVAEADGDLHATLQPGVYRIVASSYRSRVTGRFTLTVDGLPDLPTTPPRAPAISSVTPGVGSLTVSWRAPVGGAGGITAYDLRHILTSADETVNANWTVVDNAWTTGGGLLRYALTGLTGGAQYDVQVRAVNSAGDGAWSATATGTPSLPAGASATRSFSPAVAAPGGTVTVTIALENTGRAARVTEMIPSGFTYSGSSLPAIYVDTSDMAAPVFRLIEPGPSFTYDVIAPMTEGDYTFSGTLRDSTLTDRAVIGDTVVTVSSGDPLVAQYDSNRNGMIELSELFAAMDDYFGGTISLDQLFALIDLYFSGSG